MEELIKKCPYCSGTGKQKVISGTPHSYTLTDKKRAFSWKKKGFGYRTIAKKMNIPHPQTIKNLITQYIKIKNARH